MYRHSFAGCCFLVKNVSKFSSLYKATTNSSTFMLSHVMQMHPRSYKAAAGECVWSPCNTLLWHGSNVVGCGDALSKWARARYMSNTSIELKPDSDVVRFNIGEPPGKTGTSKKGKKKIKQVKMSRKAKLNELRFYRLKAKKKMTSPNPEVRIRYKLEKAKRKEEWLIEKLRKFDIPKAPAEAYDPEILTEEEKFYLKRTGEKKKNYVPVGRRGVFGGVVLNMHLHWKKHETVKVVCKPCKVVNKRDYIKVWRRPSIAHAGPLGGDFPLVTSEGHNILDVVFTSPILKLAEVAESLDKIDGVVEHGVISKIPLVFLLPLRSCFSFAMIGIRIAHYEERILSLSSNGMPLEDEDLEKLNFDRIYINFF